MASPQQTSILLVDDRPENLVALESVLADLGQNLVKATSGREALRHLLRDDFAVILLDVQMPGMDGFETASLIRQRERTQHIPIVFLTAINKAESHVNRGYSVGAVDYVFKPYDPVVLKAKVAAFVELAKKNRELEAEVHRRKQAEEEIRKLNAELERRVAERTAALEASNRDLQGQIAERKRAEEEREALFEQLQEANRRKDEFLAMLAHELRNPLAAISNAEYALEGIEAGDERVARLRGIIGRQTRHLARLVDDLLDMSRITRGKIELRREPIELSLVIQRAVETSTPFITERGHEFDVTLPTSPIWVDADPARLEQVVTNLLNNAAKYTETGGKISVTVTPPPGPASGVSPSRPVAIHVRDTGVGIEPEVLPHIFELFTQVAPTLDRSEGGLGIGLALVKSLVQMHGGTIEARSDGAGRGSEFIVWLPVLDVPAADHALRPPRGESQADSIKPRASKIPRKILLVEDNRDAAETLQEILEYWDYEVRLVGNGLEALDAAREFRPDVVLLDIGLPAMDGYEVARRLRQMEQAASSNGDGKSHRPSSNGCHAHPGDPAPGGSHRPMLLIAMTGYGQEEDRRRSHDAGFDVHLIKPVDPAELRHLLSEPTPSEPPSRPPARKARRTPRRKVAAPSKSG